MRLYTARASSRCAGASALLMTFFLSLPAMAQEEIEATTVSEPPAAAATTPAQAAPPNLSVGEGSWTGDWGLIFMLTGLGGGTNGATGPLNPTDAFGASGVLFLDKLTAIRVGMDISRIVDPRDFTEQTIRNADGDVVTVSLDDFGDTDFDVELGVDLLRRADDTEISPYYGVGAFASYGLFHRSETDDVTVPETEVEVDINNQDLDFGVRGILGVDWRVHRQISLFAEYSLSITVFDIDSNRSTTTTRSFDDGELVGEVGERTVSEQTSWLPFDLNEGHAGRVGVMFHF